MTVYNMPVPPEGYEWVVSAEEYPRSGGWSIRVNLTDGVRNYHNSYYVSDKEVKNKERNAKVVMALVDTILDLFHHGPPPPKPFPSFNGLTGPFRYG